MTKSVLAIAAVLSVLTTGGAALAQQNPYTKAPPATPISALHQDAQLNHDPAACSNAVERVAGDIGLRVQGKDGENGRMQVSTWIEAARSAAAAGDDEACWHWFDRMQNR